jgi:ribosomal-protein-alanine N-acetyltransferase
MEYVFVPMTQDYADAIVAEWKYGDAYSIYDYSNEADHILDQTAWGAGLFAVLDRTGELVGELSVEFLDANGDYTEYEQFGDTALIKSRQMWIGFGLRPDLVGRGLGTDFVKSCVHHAVEHHAYQGMSVRLGVAAFNKRAIKVYERAGFEAYDEAVGEIAGQEFDCVYMRKRLVSGHPNPSGA